MGAPAGRLSVVGTPSCLLDEASSEWPRHGGCGVGSTRGADGPERRTGPPPHSSPAPPCRRLALLPGSGAPSSAGLSGPSATSSVHFVSGAGRGGAGSRVRVRAALAGALQVRARAEPTLVKARPSPRSPYPRRPSPACECRRRRLPRLESDCRAGRRRREEGRGRRAGRKARAPARRSARDEDRTAARGATGPGPLHAEGGGRAGPPPRPGGSLPPHPLRSEGWRMSSPGSG